MLRKMLFFIFSVCLIFLSTHSSEANKINFYINEPLTTFNLSQSLQQEAINEADKLLDKIITRCGEADYLAVNINDEYNPAFNYRGIYEFRDIKRSVLVQDISPADKRNYPGIEYVCVVNYQPATFRVLDLQTKKWSPFMDTGGRFTIGGLEQIKNAVPALGVSLRKINGRWEGKKGAVKYHYDCSYYESFESSQPANNNPSKPTINNSPTPNSNPTSSSLGVDKNSLLASLRDLTSKNNQVKDCLNKQQHSIEEFNNIFDVQPVYVHKENRYEVLISVNSNNDVCGLCNSQGCPKWIYKGKLLSKFGAEPILDGVYARSLTVLETYSNDYKDLRLTVGLGDKVEAAIYKFDGKHYIKTSTSSLENNPNISSNESNKNIWVYSNKADESINTRTFSELGDFIVFLDRTPKTRNNLVFKYRVTVIATKKQVELKTVSLTALFDKDNYVYIDSTRTLRNVSKGGLDIYKDMRNDISASDKATGWGDFSVAEATFEDQQIAGDVIKGFYDTLAQYTLDFKLIPGVSEHLQEGITALGVVNYVRTVVNDLSLLNKQAPTINPSSEFLNKLHDINQQKKIEFAATQLKGDLEFLHNCYGIRFEFIVDETAGGAPIFFLKAQNGDKKVIGVEIGPDRKNPKVMSAIVR